MGEGPVARAAPLETLLQISDPLGRRHILRRNLHLEVVHLLLRRLCLALVRLHNAIIPLMHSKSRRLHVRLRLDVQVLEALKNFVVLGLRSSQLLLHRVHVLTRLMPYQKVVLGRSSNVSLELHDPGLELTDLATCKNGGQIN
jgi:hypothetical protein